MQNANVKQPNREKTLSHFPHFLIWFQTIMAKSSLLNVSITKKKYY